MKNAIPSLCRASSTQYGQHLGNRISATTATQNQDDTTFHRSLYPSCPTVVLSCQYVLPNSPHIHHRLPSRSFYIRSRHALTVQAVESGFAIRSNGYEYYDANTKKFLIDALPEVHYDVGEMYGGLIPIDESDLSRPLYFIFKPVIGAATDGLPIYLDGGPGCSSLISFFQENVPFLWQAGT